MLLTPEAGPSKRETDPTGLKQLEQDVEKPAIDEIDDLNVEKVVEWPESFSDPQRMTIFAVVFLITLACAMTVYWARIYLGVHSITQVTSGALLGLIYSDWFFSLNYETRITKFMVGFFLNFQAPNQRRDMIGLRVLVLLIFNTLLALLYAVRLSYPPEAKPEWIKNMNAGMCLSPCSKGMTFEWKDYTAALFINLFLIFDLAMLTLNLEGYRYDKNHFRHMHWKHVFLRNFLFFTCLGIAFLPEMILKPLKIQNDFLVVAARFFSSFALAGLVVYLVPSIYKACQIEARGGFI
jgi:hypothetical protein